MLNTGHVLPGDGWYPGAAIRSTASRKLSKRKRCQKKRTQHVNFEIRKEVGIL